MNILAELVPLLLSIIGSMLGLVSKRVAVRDAVAHAERVTRSVDPSQPPKPPMPAGQKVLVGFAVIVAVFGLLMIVRYWSFLKQNQDVVFFAVGLFLTMIGGMFVQVVVANYKAGHPLFDVTASQLIFPLLFSIIVFYPIWAIGTGSEKSFFAFYAAFLNGYFWETVVASAKVPAPKNSGG